MKKTIIISNAKSICQRFKAFREGLGFEKPVYFAKRLKMNYTTYLNYEKQRVPPSDVLWLMKEKFGKKFDINWILAGDETRKDENSFELIAGKEDQEYLKKACSVFKSKTKTSASLKEYIDFLHGKTLIESKKKLQTATKAGLEF
ncbi:MAG TPA: hypothetical protein ENI07_14265 [Desulfobacterales bacterium]|nr:hypothetical protein [Desulfobacterales bacterium]